VTKNWLRGVVLVLGTVPALSCNEVPASVLSAPPTIVPAAATIRVGEAQVFAVRNASVVRFDLSADRQKWSECVRVDPDFTEPNSIRLVAYQQCSGFVYIVAGIGNGRSPVAAVMAVQ
jgi:hypothetical protein